MAATTMQNTINQLRRLSPVRYLFIGGASYIIEMSALLFFNRVLDISPIISVAISFWIGLGASFSLQKYIAFKNKESDRKTLGKQVFLYGLLVLLNYTFTLLFVHYATNVLGIEIARTAALAVTVCWNYFAYKKIFRQPNLQ